MDLAFSAYAALTLQTSWKDLFPSRNILRICFLATLRIEQLRRVILSRIRPHLALGLTRPRQWSTLWLFSSWSNPEVMQISFLETFLLLLLWSSEPLLAYQYRYAFSCASTSMLRIEQQSYFRHSSSLSTKLTSKPKSCMAEGEWRIRTITGKTKRQNLDVWAEYPTK